MPESSDEYCSDLLPAERMRQAMEALADVFRSLLGDCIVTAYYGFGSEIHADLQYAPMRVGTRWIDRFISDSIERGIVTPGHCDFSFTISDQRLQVLFCHESDIHVSGKDNALIQQFISAKPFCEIRFRSKAQKETAR